MFAHVVSAIAGLAFVLSLRTSGGLREPLDDKRSNEDLPRVEKRALISLCSFNIVFADIISSMFERVVLTLAGPYTPALGEHG